MLFAQKKIERSKCIGCVVLISGKMIPLPMVMLLRATATASIPLDCSVFYLIFSLFSSFQLPSYSTCWLRHWIVAGAFPDFIQSDRETPIRSRVVRVYMRFIMCFSLSNSIISKLMLFNVFYVYLCMFYPVAEGERATEQENESWNCVIMSRLSS